MTILQAPFLHSNPARDEEQLIVNGPQNITGPALCQGAASVLLC